MEARSAILWLLLAVIAAAAVVSGTNVQQCRGRSIANLSDNVQLPSCKKHPCKLRKGTEQHVNIKFIPEHDIESLKNKVSADIGVGINLPFIGVDGTSVCDKLYTESGESAPCPLKAGNTYVYKYSFPILNIYPLVSVKVHWALVDGNDKDITCFEVPAKIVKGT